MKSRRLEMTISAVGMIIATVWLLSLPDESVLTPTIQTDLSPEPSAPQKIPLIKTPAAHPQPESSLVMSQGVTIRAYCPCTICCGPNADGRVKYKNYPVHDSMIAISRDLEKDIPLGSHMYLPGYGWCLVADRTHKKRVAQIEILFTYGVRGYPGEHQAAWHFPTTDAQLSIQDGKIWISQWPGYDRPLRYMKTNRWLRSSEMK